MGINELEKFYSQTTVNINGIITNAKDAKVSIFDRGFLYGDSIYEVIYSKDFIPIYFDEHVQRLIKSAQLLGMNFFTDLDQIKKATIETLKESQIPNAYARIIVTRGETPLTLDPNSSFKNNLIIIVKQRPQHPQRFYDHGINLKVVSILRNDKHAHNPNAKSGNYLNNVLAMGQAKNAGADDALMLNRDGLVTEGSTFNIWIIKDGYIITPPSQAGILEGITRQRVLEICDREKLPLKVENITPEDIKNAQEAFITSSTRSIMPVKQIDDTIYGESVDDWPMTGKISLLYDQLLEESINCKKYYYGPA